MLNISYSRIYEEFKDRVKVSDEVRKISEKYRFLPYMIARYVDMLGESETIELLESFDKKDLYKPAIVCNPMRIECSELVNRLVDQGFGLEKILWSSYAYRVIRSPRSPTLGSTHEFMKGYYYIYRDPASLIPPLLIEPREDEDILDCCAAPGGKSIYMIILKKDRGLVISNDISRERLKALRFNLDRLGLRSYVITRFDARKTHEIFREELKKILVDAPCSAEGAIMFDRSRRYRTDYETLAKLVSREIEILSSSIEALAPGGVIVYATCSIAPEENEYVVSKILEHYDKQVEVVSPVFNMWSRGLRGFLGLEFSPEVEKCVRVWPHRHSMEGYFICVLRRK